IAVSRKCHGPLDPFNISDRSVIVNWKSGGLMQMGILINILTNKNYLWLQQGHEADNAILAPQFRHHDRAQSASSRELSLENLGHLPYPGMHARPSQTDSPARSRQPVVREIAGHAPEKVARRARTHPEAGRPGSGHLSIRSQRLGKRHDV